MSETVARQRGGATRALRGQGREATASEGQASRAMKFSVVCKEDFYNHSQRELLIEIDDLVKSRTGEAACLRLNSLEPVPEDSEAPASADPL